MGMTARTAATLTVLTLSGLVRAAAPLPVTLADPRNGRPVELRAGAKALHIVFFATWCPPCVSELDRLAAFEARARSKGYRLVLVAVQTRHTRERLADFIDKRRPPGELLHDAEGIAGRAFGAEQLPLHVVLDSGGAVVQRSGALDGAVEQAIERLLGGGPP